MFLVSLVFLALVRLSELAPSGVPESSSSLPAARKKSQNLGSLSDFTWQAWLLVDTQTGSQPGMDSATLLRRITPKSVFIAPALPACADGYRADTMNRCVKSVNIDENAHFSFLLQRLNALYANQDNNPQASSKNEQKQSTGPLQLNIPLIPDSKSQSTKVELAETFSMNDPIDTAMPDEAVPPGDDDEKTRPQEAIATVYEIKHNATSNDEKESMFFLGNSSADDVDKANEKSDAVVPVAEFVEETNDTSFSEVVDYKIPIDLKSLFNASSTKKIDASAVEREGVAMTDKRDNSTEMSPTLVLLVSSTKLPSTVINPETDEPPLAQNDTTDHAMLQTSNFTTNATTNATMKETIRDVGVLDSDKFPLTWKLPEDFPITAVDKDQSNETHGMGSEDAGSRPESTKLNDSRETEFAYDEEEEDDEYPYTTDVPDEESAETEGEEEILKHGEAGMTIPARKVEWLHHGQQQEQNQTTQTKQDEKKAVDVQDRVVIRFNETLPAATDETGSSSVSSEVSIDGDVILETTLLDVNTERLQVTTKSPEFAVTRRVTTGNGNESRESLDEDYSTVPEVVFSSQDTHGTTSTGLHGRKQAAEQQQQLLAIVDTQTENERFEHSEAAPSSSDSLYDPPEEDPITEIYEDQTSDVGESALEASSKAAGPALRTFVGHDVTANSFKRTSMNLGPAEDFVRFPDQVARQSQDHVRFPSSEVNSIHSQSYKQHSLYPADNAPYGGTSTKSSVPGRQKPSVYHLTAPSWKPERQQQPLEHVPAAMAVQRQKKQPALLRFWSKMPLVRDPAIYPVRRFPTNRSDDQGDVIREQPRDQSRRSSSRSPHSETPSRDNNNNSNNKVLTRKRRRTSTRD